MDHPIPMMNSDEYGAAEWKFFLCQFQLPELCLEGNLDDLTSFDWLARLASFSLKYLARSSSKLSFGFLPLCLKRSLPPFVLGRSDLRIYGLPWSEPIWPVWTTGLTNLVPVWLVGSTCLTLFLQGNRGNRLLFWLGETCRPPGASWRITELIVLKNIIAL